MNWTSWPLLEVSAAELPHDQARTLIGNVLRSALERCEPFAAVVHMPSTTQERVRGRVRAATDQVRVVRQLRPGLKQYCRGLAFVLTAQALHEHAKVIKSGAKIWGCAVTAVSDVDEARDWARAQLTGGA